MNELPQDFFPADATPEVKALFENPEVVKLVMGYNQGLVDKKTELLGKLSTKEAVLKDLGDVDAVRQKLQEYDALVAEKSTWQQSKAKPEDIDARITEMQRLIQERDDKLNALTEKRANSERQRALKSAMKDAGVQDPDLLFPHVEGRVKTKVTDSDDVAFEFYTADGKPLLTDNGNPAQITDLMKEFKTSSRYAPFFAAENIGGAGSRSGNPGNAGVDNPWMKDSPNYNNVAEQTRIYKENKALAVQLASQAGEKLE